MAKTNKQNKKLSIPKLIFSVVAIYTIFFVSNLPYKKFPLPVTQFRFESDASIQFPIKYKFCYSLLNFFTDGSFIPYSTHCSDNLETDQNGFFTLPVKQITADIRFPYFNDLSIIAGSSQGDSSCKYLLSFRPNSSPFQAPSETYPQTNSIITITCQRDPLGQDVISITELKSI